MDNFYYWPDSLPQKLLQRGFNEAPRDQTIRTSMDIGVDKVRQRFTGQIFDSSVNLILTHDQYETLQNFFFNDLQGGVNQFVLAHPITGITHRWRFTRPFSATPASGTKLSVSMNWERLPE